VFCLLASSWAPCKRAKRATQKCRRLLNLGIWRPSVTATAAHTSAGMLYLMHVLALKMLASQGRREETKLSKTAEGADIK